MQATWYVLEDGRKVDPNEVAPGEGGVLMHSSGVAVAMRGPGVPRTSGVDPVAERAKAEAAGKAKADAEAKAKADADAKSKADADAKAKADVDAKAGKGKPAADGKAMKPEEQGGAYKTRETKAD